MNWATAITTAPRDEYYLPAAMASIQSAGWIDAAEPIIFAEPDSPGLTEVESSWQVVGADRKMGSWPNFMRAISTLVEWRPTAEFYAVFQDDILVAADCRAWLEPVLSDDAFTSLYCSEAAGECRSGWFQVDQGQAKRQAHGALAVIMPRHLARLLIRERPGKGSLTKTDIHLGRFCDEHGIPYWFHAPSLVSHLGRVSAIRHVPGEKFPRPERPWGKFRHEGAWLDHIVPE
jgi:hypothetical protein